MSTQFSEWYKTVARESVPSLLTLLDVVKLAQRRSQFSFQHLKPPFLFADAAKYTVDPSTSSLIQDGLDLTLIPPKGRELAMAGLEPLPVVSMNAILSVKQDTVTLHVKLGGDMTPTCSFTLPPGKSPVDIYLESIGYQAKLQEISLSTLASAIVRPETVFSFWSILPSFLCGVIELPSWNVDLVLSEITAENTVFGPIVQRAELIAKPTVKKIDEIQFDGFALLPTEVALLITRNVDQAYILGLRLSFKLGNFLVSAKLSKTPGYEAFSLECEVSTPISLNTLLPLLGLPVNEVTLPIEGGDPVSSKDELRVGFGLAQHVASVHAPLNLEYISIGISSKDRATWKKLLPSPLQPSDDSSLSIIVKLLKPTTKPIKVGIIVDYAIEIDKSLSPLHFRFSYMPLLVALPPPNQYTYRTSVSMYADEDSGKPSADIKRVLDRVAGSSWQKVVEIIPVLGTITEAITIKRAFFEVENNQGSSSISSFALRAHITNLEVFSSPSLIVQEAELGLVYNDLGWNGSVATEILFAKRFQVETYLQLPTKTSPGIFQFTNRDPKFTFQELVTAIDPSLKPADVPIIGPELASVVLSHFSLQVVYNDKHALEVSAFDIKLLWGSTSVGNIQTINNRLVISWNKTRILESGKPEAGNTSTSLSNWSILWEGQLSPQVFLYANLSLITAANDKKQTIISGEIIHIDKPSSAGALVNMLTSNDSTNATSSSNYWETSFPSTTKTEFSLDRCELSISLGEEHIYKTAAQFSWGSSQAMGALILEKKDVKDEPWRFIFALGVKNFHFGDLLSDNGLADTITQYVVITDAQVLGFRNPTNIKLSLLRKRVADAAPWSILKEPENMEKLDDTHEVGTGLAVVASLQISSEKDPLLTKMVAVSDSKYSHTSIQIFCLFSKSSAQPASTQDPDKKALTSSADSSTSVVLAASISSFPILDSISLENVQFQYSFSTKKGAKTTYSKALMLKGTCRLRFPESQSTWSFTSTLDISDASATLSVESNPHDTIDLFGKVSFTQIALSIKYVFASPTEASPTESKDIVKHGNTTAHYEIELHATVKLGSVHATGSILFLSGKPQIATIYAPNEVKISDIFHEIFGSDLLADLLPLSFSDFRLWYSWSKTDVSLEDGLITTDKAKKEIRAYKPGFRAQALANVVGFQFFISMDVHMGDDSQKGLVITGTLKKAVNLFIFVLRDKDDKDKGPSLAYSTKKKPDGKPEGCYIETGIEILGTYIGYGQLRYSKAGAESKATFSLDFAVKADVVKDVNLKIPFELSEKDGKPHLRFIGLPLKDMDDIFSADQLIGKISELTSKDACGAIDLIKKAVKTTFSVSLSISDDQPTQEEGKPHQFAFDVNGQWKIECAGQAVDEIKFKPLKLKAEVPKDWGSLFTSVINLLKSEDSLESIVKALKENAGQFTKVLIILGVKELAFEGLKSWACRNKPQKRPKSDLGEDVKDTGGPKGDGPNGSGGSGPVGGGLLTLIFEDFVAGAFIVAGGAIALFFGWLLSGSSRDSSLTKPPTPKPLPEPTEPFEMAIFAALNKEFDRWRKCNSYEEALETVYLCALDYQGAISMLRWVLKDARTSISLDTENDYISRLEFYIHEFSQLSVEFGTQWLTFKKLPSMEIHSTHFTLSWSDDLRGRWLAVSVQGVNFVLPPTYGSQNYTMRWPKKISSQKLNENIIAKLVLFTTCDRDGSDYRFYSQGPQTSSSPAWYIIRSELFGDDAATAPVFDDYNDPALQVSSGGTRLTPNHSIRSLTIRYGWIVDGIAVEYKLVDGSIVSVEHGSTNDTGHISKVTLKDSEFISKITGKSGEHSYYQNWPYVHQISFTIEDHATSQSRVEGPFGNLDRRNEGEAFSIDGPISGFSGRAENGPKHRGLAALAFIRAQFASGSVPHS